MVNSAIYQGHQFLPTLSINRAIDMKSITRLPGLIAFLLLLD
jgi:hypothetical protein